jgi:hypothetical protein
MDNVAFLGSPPQQGAQDQHRQGAQDQHPPDHNGPYVLRPAARVLGKLIEARRQSASHLSSISWVANADSRIHSGNGGGSKLGLLLSALSRLLRTMGCSTPGGVVGRPPVLDLGDARKVVEMGVDRVEVGGSSEAATYGGNTNCSVGDGT